MKEQGLSITYPADKKARYRLLRTQLQGLTDKAAGLTASLANISALLNQALTEINWVGFYLMKDGQLVLGPFQGKPACVKISVGCGVCGTSVARDEIMLVENVHEFPGHIACDSASRSEIVIPIHERGAVVAVLDVDSPVIGRFDEEDRDGLAGLMRELEKLLYSGSEDEEDGRETATDEKAGARPEILAAGPGKDRLDRFNDRIKKFISDRNWDKDPSRRPSSLAKSISIEAAELLECFQWDDENYDREHVLEELADVLNYSIQMTQILDVDLVDIVHSKMNITEKKYPVDRV